MLLENPLLIARVRNLYLLVSGDYPQNTDPNAQTYEPGRGYSRQVKPLQQLLKFAPYFDEAQYVIDPPQPWVEPPP